MEIANAGHLPPLLLDPVGGAGRFVSEHGPLLGLNLPQPGSVRREIPPGTVLLLVTDGLVEVRGVDLAVSLEELRVSAAGAPRDPDRLCRALLDAFDRPQEDDIVLFAARMGATGTPGPAPGTANAATGAEA